MANTQIRQEIRRAGIYQYQVADALGVSEMTFIRWLRKPLSSDLEAKVRAVIETVKKEVS